MLWGWSYGDCVDEDDVAADAEGGVGVGDGDGVVECGAGGHEGRGGKGAGGCSSAMARLTPGVRPKSSALRIRRGGMRSCEVAEDEVSRVHGRVGGQRDASAVHHLFSK